jgi:hypothetical protein
MPSVFRTFLYLPEQFLRTIDVAIFKSLFKATNPWWLLCQYVQHVHTFTAKRLTWYLYCYMIFNVHLQL